MDQAVQDPPASLLEGSALFLDFDGTLVELAETPDAVRVASSLPNLLRKLARRLEGRLAIISGRSIGDLERHLDCADTAVAGSHGHELRFANGTHVPLSVPEGLDQAIAEAKRLGAEVPGLLVEEKPAGIAVHYRRAAEHADRVTRFMAALAESTGMAMLSGKMLVELRPFGVDKGRALRAFMAEPPFAGARPVFVGDDLTDEDAFEAAAALGGDGVLVGPPRPTAARWRLENVEAVAEWLARSVRIDA